MDKLEPASALPFQTAGEWAAHLRWRSLVARESGVSAWTKELIGDPIDRLEASIFRTEGITLADRAVVAAMRRLGSLSRRALLVERTLDTYRERGHDVHDLKDVRALPLDEIDEVLQGFSSTYLLGAGLGGAVMGMFGALGVFGGIPPLMFASLHAIHRLGLYYGHDPEAVSERQFAILVLATSLVSRPSLRSGVVERLQAFSWDLEVSPHEPGFDPHADKITENVAEALATQIALGLVTRSWPLAGLVVGAGYSRAFVAQACDTARAAFGQRALLRRYGSAARVATRPAR